MTDDPRTYLHQTGTVYVTAAAARTYGEETGLRPEEARRELTEYLLDATQTAPAQDGRPEAWRRRTRSSGVDVTARVSREGRLAVVVSVSVRGYGPPRGGRDRA